MSDGTGQPKQLVTSRYHQQPKCISKDGKIVIYTEGINPETGMDIWMIQMEGDSNPKPLLNSHFNEAHPVLSPEGNWLAYMTDETGQNEVFVRSFPDLENKTQI
jgi:Tol biopolymer transport system component